MKILKSLLIICFFLTTQNSWSIGLYSNYKARILKADGTPFEKRSVNFKFSIMNPAKNCTLYAETYSMINLEGSSGYVSFNIGAGTKVYPTNSTKYIDILKNGTTFTCQQGSTFTGSASDSRVIIMQFNDIETTKWQTTTPMTIGSVPYANYASLSDNAKALDGSLKSDFVQYASLPLTCTTGQALSFVGGSFSCVNSSSSNSVITNGGNSYGTSATVGTSDAYAFNIETNNVNRLTVTSTGQIGLGTTQPEAQLHLSTTQTTSGVILGDAPDFSNSFMGYVSNSFAMLGKNVTDPISSGSLGYSSVNISPSIIQNATATEYVSSLTLQPRISGSGHFGGISGINSAPIYEGSGNLTFGNFGVMSTPQIATGNIVSLSAFWAQNFIYGGSVYSSVGLNVASSQNSGGTIQEVIGLRVADQIGSNLSVSNTAIRTQQTTGYTMYNSGVASSYFAGAIGIGKSNPQVALDVSGTVISSGQIVTGSYSTSSSAIDFNYGNSITTSFDCGSSMSFTNLKDGGTYTLAVTGTGTNQCNFDGLIDGTVVTYRFKPANDARYASSHTLYSMTRIGNTVYVSWSSGF